MIIITTLVIPPGGDAGPFDLYSDADGYTVPFATNVSVLQLEAGYSSTVPDNATSIKVVSVGICTNFIILDIDLIPTTTTTSSSTSTIMNMKMGERNSLKFISIPMLNHEQQLIDAPYKTLNRDDEKTPLIRLY